ncbi:hypothetical protein J5N97_028035 [Dioscorea zingiberensis]|uniref:Transcription repressor n=1 Tax=Dioscorea zingiberensis TaxID=325984 RepID=A0A9D5H4G3_9LILI|nr:hypothetical protein J5N97_028035 [Dioscorea zingiberensis]
MESISNKKNSSSNSSSRLKQRLAWFFNGSRLLHAACATTSDKALQDPVFVPGPRHRLLGHPSLSSSTENRPRGPTLPSIHYSLNCSSCKPTRPLPVTRKERRVTGTGLDDTADTGDQEGRTCPPASPTSPSKNSFGSYSFNNILKEKTKKKLLSNGYGFTTSSSSDDEEFGGFFSSEEGDHDQQGKEESETLISSKSFSSDSSEFYQRPSSIAHRKKAINNKISYRQVTREGYHQLKHNSSISSREDQTKIKKKKKMRQRLAMDDDNDDDGDDEKGENGFAVVKRSKDPYGDFRSSMVEMIVERQMFSGEELEKLLQSYLSLNSQHHHPIILRAFSDIWEALIIN